MKRQEQVKRNMELFSIFMMKALNSPELRDQVPDNADLIFLPDNDAELKKANLRLAEELRRKGKKPILIRISYIPETMTVLVPQIELLETA